MNSATTRNIAALLAGLVFGLGLAISGMIDPARVLSFLDVLGGWNPSLIFVLGGGVVVTFLAVILMIRMKHPVLDSQFHLPRTSPIDRPLILGSAIFGIGWGLVGLCPGPAIAALSLGSTKVLVFVIAMVAGMVIHDRSRKPTL